MLQENRCRRWNSIVENVLVSTRSRLLPPPSTEGSRRSRGRGNGRRTNVSTLRHEEVRRSRCRTNYPPPFFFFLSAFLSSPACSFHFWPGPSHPLGGGWTVSPEDYHNHPGGSRHNTHNFYLGYSIEKYCKAHTYVDKNERKNRAFVFAKQVSYFDESHFVFWNNDRTFADMKEKLHIDFLAVAGNAKDKLEDPGLTNIGRQPMDQFYEEVANSKLMVGTGSPWLSPTPYDGLCLGLPFINPINGFNRNDPDDREEWNCQHNGLWAMEPPYVYMVHREDIKGLEDAIRQAKNNPIDSYTPPHMTIESNTLRHKNLINLNWRNLALVREQELREVAERKDYLKLFLV